MWEVKRKNAEWKTGDIAQLVELKSCMHQVSGLGGRGVGEQVQAIAKGYRLQLRKFIQYSAAATGAGVWRNEDQLQGESRGHR